MSATDQLSYFDSIQEAKDSMYRFPLIPVRGVPLMNYIANNWDSIWAFEPHPSDLLIATYPKAGLDLLKDMPPPRVIKTHLPFQLVPQGFWKNKCKAIYVARNAKDNLNPQREVERIMRYLEVSLADDVISHIVELTSFKAMKENPMANYTTIPPPVFDQTISSFMRKGMVGDWNNHFTPEQSRAFDEDYERQMKGCNIPFRTTI
ncbi:hypothetical protein CRUP_013916 [Coryphaenoides rupestris]|nr:hypothetical protein CRUP_013916 [Coryphaenoides rupestris]